MPQINHPLDPEPSEFKGANRPIEGVSWHEAIEFCARLWQYSGRDYRLPSEAEWEYACRAGTVSPFHYGEAITTDYANYWGEHQNVNGNLHKGNYGSAPIGVARQSTTEVGHFRIANAFGLYDMHGNVWEWCSGEGSDTYFNDSPDYWLIVDSLENGQKPLRGGAWICPPRLCRSACRFFEDADRYYAWVGFRIVCSMTDHRTFPPSSSPGMVESVALTLESGMTRLETILQEGLKKMSDTPKYNFPNAKKVQIFEKVEGGYHEHNYAQEQGFEILLTDYKQFIKELQQKHPNATDEAAIAKIIAVEYQEVKRLQPQRWQNFLSFKRLLNGGKKAIVKGGEHFTEHNFWGKIGVALLEGVMEEPS